MNDFDWSIIRNPKFRNRLRIPPVLRDDALQDAFIKLIGREVTPQLFRVAAENCYKDRAKRDSRRRRREQLSASLPGQSDHKSAGASILSQQLIMRYWEVLSYSCDPSEKIERRETRAAIMRAVREAQLPRNHRCALWAWSRGCVAKFAERRGIPQGTVRVWVKRAMDKLRPHLTRQGLEPD